MLRFEWDEEKNRGNRTKHGVWFEEAQSAFRDPNARLFHDPEHSEEEDRFILIGVSSTTRSLVDSHRNFLPPSWLLSRLHVNTIESVVFGDYRDRIEGLNLAA